MARFLGEVSGRTTVPYTDATVNTACSNLCSYVNTNKLSCSGGNGSQLTNIVTSISAGSGISVNQSTGVVTVSASGGSAPVILYNCACQCYNYGMCIPSASRGVFQRYEIIGGVCSWNYYCSQATFQFGGACNGACQPNNYGSNRYCCSIMSCGSINQFKCFNGSYMYSCAGAIAWPFGCSSSCFSACTAYPMQYHIALTPVFPCCGSNRCFTYCFRTTNNSNYSAGNCCFGGSNHGSATPCCGAHPACLQCICLTTPSATGNTTGNITVIGYGRLTV